MKLNLQSKFGLVLIVLGIALIGYGEVEAHSAIHRPCPTVAKCRQAIAWNHSVIATINHRIAIANGAMAGGGRVPAACHAVESCRAHLAQQKHARLEAEGAWMHLRTDESAAGAHRIVRYLFAPCGAEAQRRAILIVGWESGWQRFNINGAGDTSWWQIERPAHPDVTLAQAEDDWRSTEWAVRASSCGTNFSPEWSSVRDHGQHWG